MNGILDRLRSRSGNKRIRAEPELAGATTEPRVHEEVEGSETSSNEILPDVPQERHSEGSGNGATEGDVQRQSEGSAHLSGEAPR